MAFQDFDRVHELRKLERRKKFRKMICFSVISSLLLISVGICTFFTLKKKVLETPSNQDEPKMQIENSEKLIKEFCNNGVSYKESCTTTLEKAVKDNPSLATPQDFLKSLISATAVELDKELTNVGAFKFTSAMDEKALDVCKEVIANAKEELFTSAAKVEEKDVSDVDEMNSLLSAVMSYQETCIDSFSNGELKNNVRRSLNSSQELTSNSLAMISKLSSNISSKEVAGRRLLESGFPNWLNHEYGRMLKGSNRTKWKPNVIVAKDGSEKFKTISAALEAMPKKYDGRYVIYIKEGIYNEDVHVTKKMVNLTIYGDGSQKTIITGKKNYVDGIPTYQTATFVASGEGFLAEAIGFRNTAGPEKHQAVAARVDADKAVFHNCRFEGFQDTLYVQNHRQFYRSCVISGTIDFIFGDAAAVFQKCLIYVRKPMEKQKNIVTAQGRKDKLEKTGIVLQNCKILADESFASVQKNFKSYLGRPWKEYSRTIVMESLIEDLIDPAGWLESEGDFALKTLYYAEYDNEGAGAKTDARVNWPGRKVIKKDEAMKFTVENFLPGTWIKETGSSVRMGLGS